MVVVTGFTPQFDGQLDKTHPWQQPPPDWMNQSDRVAFERSLNSTGKLEDRKMALAMWCADPGTPRDEIRNLLINPLMTPRNARISKVEPSIGQVLDIDQPDSHSLFDFTNTAVSVAATMRPALGTGPND